MFVILMKTFFILNEDKNNLIFNLYGKLSGLNLVISPKSIDFGTVSYGFLYKKEFNIENKRDIGCVYLLGLKLDGTIQRREIYGVPVTGIIT
jgi:hypothetical protein